MKKIVRIIDNSLYPKRLVSETRNAFKQHCLIQAEAIQNNRVKLYFEIINTQYSESDIVLEFMNYLLELTAMLEMERNDG